MGLLWLVLAGIALWGLIRLGRQTEGPRRGHWRVSATLFSAVLLAGGALAAFRSSWWLAIALTGAGLWLTLASRRRDVAPRAQSLTESEARATLGVGPDATTAEINTAWKRLMARAHPDQGGTEGLAARLNAARDMLLKK